MRTLAILFLLSPLPPATGAEIWVDREKGRDTNPGTEALPLASVPAALKRLEPGTTLHLVPGETPWPGDIRILASGTEEAPIVVDGHGSVVSGKRVLPPEDWSPEGNGIFHRKLPNNAWGMETHWEGGFPLVWFDGTPGRNVTSRAELVPGSYFLHKNRKKAKEDPLHNTLFVHLPAGKNFSNCRVASIAGESGIFVGGDHVVVRNVITEFGGRDGFATHRNTGVVFENVEARFFMDQGMSHHGAEVLVRNSRFHHNAGGGVVDVYPEVKVRYENCVMESDTWRGGVELHSGEFHLVGCRIRNNPKKALTVSRGARVTLENCTLEFTLDGEEPPPAIHLDAGGALLLDGCRIDGASTGVSAVLTGHTRLELRNTTLQRCGSNLRLVLRQARNDPPLPVLNRMLHLSENRFAPAPFVLIRKTENITSPGWKVAEETIDASELIERLDVSAEP